MNHSKLLTATLVAAAAAVSFPAFAQEAAPTSSVGYADLDLASRAGAHALKQRVARAAKRVCTFQGDKSVEGAVEARHCARLALARAMPQVELALARAGTQLAENGRIAVAAN